MKKKMMCLLTAVIMVVIAAFSLTGCKVQNSSENNKTPTVEAEHNEGASVNITIESHAEKQEKNLVQTWANAFMRENKDVNITVSPRGGINTMSDIVTMEQEGKLPDICWTAGDQHSPWSGTGYFQDLSDEAKFPGSAEFFGGMYDAIVDTTHYSNKDNGKWFVPRDYNRLVIIVNKTAFEKCGVELPKANWTFADMEKTAKALKAGKDGYVSETPLELRAWAPVYTTMMTNFGASYVSADGKCNLKYTDASGNCPGKNVWDWYDSVLSKETGYAMRSGEGATFRGFNPKARKCTSAMVVDTYAQLWKYVQAAEKNNYVIDALPFPSFTDADNKCGYVGAGCSGYAITKACTDSAKRDAAWKFLKYCISEKGYDEVASLGVVCPVLKSMADKGKWRDYADKNGNKINPDAFIATNTEDIDLNYQNVLDDVGKQDLLIGYADTFWKNNGNSTFELSEDQFRGFFNSTIDNE